VSSFGGSSFCSDKCSKEDFAEYEKEITREIIESGDFNE